MHKLALSVLLALNLGQTVLADQTFTWATTWVSAAPDGFTRPVIGINGVWPCPTITGKVGEVITIQLTNQLGNESTSLHFHGLKQLSTPFMDGPSGVAQCPIAPGSTLTYKFVLDSPGTYWYHSHNKGQYPDGLRAPIIVEYPDLPWKFTAEYVLTLSDWYHKQAPAIINAFQSPPQGPPETPSPDSIIMNDGVFSSYKMIPGNTYLFHIINMGAFPSFFVNFANAGFSVIGLDGTTTHNSSTPAGTLYVGAAQRYRVLVVAPKNPTTQGAFTAVVDTSMFEAPYSGPTAIFGTLDYGLTTKPSNVYNSSISAGTFPNTIMPPADDLTFKPLTTVTLYGPVTKQFVLNFNFGLVNGIARALINNVTYLPQKVPSLYTALTAPEALRNNSAIYGQINPLVVSQGDVVEIVINNLTPAGHPWHIHGHQFQVVSRGTAQGTYTPSMADPAPMMRDVAGVQPNGYVVFRFVANNPGIQLLHCHIEWHVEAGLTASIIEAADKMQHLSLPADHIQNCKNGGYLSAGNAGGSTTNWTDSSNFNTVVPQVNNGALWSGPGSKLKRQALKFSA